MSRIDPSGCSNVCTLEEILDAESKAHELVAIIAIRISEGPSTFRDVMQCNMYQGVQYRYLLLAHGERTLKSSFIRFQKSLNPENAFSFQGRLIDYIYVESDITLIDPARSERRGFILGDDVTDGSFHLEVKGASLLRMCDRFSYLWQVGRDLD